MARVSAIAPAMSGAFLLLGDGSTAFLAENEAAPTRQPIARSVQDGQILPVRITRAALGGKGPRVTAKLTLAESAPARDRLGLIARGPDAALRLATRLPSAMVLTDGTALALRLSRELGAARLQRVPRAFDAALEEEFTALAEAEVPLPGGGRLLVHPTPALTAIDVDSGAGDAQTVNRRAVVEAARQIRLRNIGGAILLDLAGLSPRQRGALEEPFAAALAADPLGPRLLGLTRLGLMEVVRPRIHPALHEVLGLPASPLTHGLAALRRAAAEAAAMPAQALALRAQPAVLAALESLPGALAAYVADAGRALLLRPDPLLPAGREIVEPV
jgi:Ribonuclease G/E